MSRDAKQEATSDRYYAGVGMNITRLSNKIKNGYVMDYDLRGLSIRFPSPEGGEFLIVLRAFDPDGTPVVAFHSALELQEALGGLETRLDNGSLRWRPDEYAR